MGKSIYGGGMRKLALGWMVTFLVSVSTPTEARIPASDANQDPASSLAKGELGIASWYGEEFQGNETASGEAFDMNGLTAAHRDLPLGTLVKVTNMGNNRSLALRVNDRGPFIPGRFLDVSMAAAKRLGFLGSGLALVQVEVISYPKGYTSEGAWRPPQAAANLSTD
jgi:rare lipoprotein A